MKRELLALALLSAPAAAGEFLVSGRFLYEDRGWNWAGWTGALTERPVRRADVRVLDAQTGRTLGRGRTDASGAFSLVARSEHACDVVVRVESSNRIRIPGEAPMPRLVVLDDLGERWSATSPVFAAHDPAQALDAGTTVALAVVVAGSPGNPFNVWDMAVSAWEWLEGTAGAAPRGPLRLQWPSWTGSWALGRTARVADDDGDDDAVILHEIGHLVHNAWSDNDSPGGMHWFGDSDQDPRLAFSEGWATAFAGAVLEALGQAPLYVDCDAGAASGGVELRLDLESLAPYATASEGSADEVAVAGALFDLLDAAPPGDGGDDAFAPGLVPGLPDPARALWQVFAGPVRRARRAAVNSAWDGWARVHDAGHAELRAVFDAFALRFWNDGFEPDNEPGQATPIEPDGLYGPEHTLYWSPFEPADSGVGDEDWFSVPLQAGQVVRVETRYPGGAADARTQADTQLAVFDPQGRRVAEDEDGGAGRNARVEGLAVDQTGTWRLRVRSTDPLHRYGRYELRVLLQPAP